MSKPVVSYRRIVAAFAAWWSIWTAEQALVITQNGFDWNTALTDAVVTQLIFAGAAYTINTSMSFFQPGPRNGVYVLIWTITLATICVFVQRLVLLRLLENVEGYPGFLENSLQIRGAFGWLMIALIAVLTWFWVYVRERQETEQRKNDAIQLAREAELTNLRQQLQPHFLFNSLNSISALTSIHPEEAKKMVQQLSDFLRGTMKKDDKTSSTLEEEMGHLQLYLEIEKVRFGHRLKTDIQIGEGALSLRLPPLLLQPVVENAIKFGLYDTVGEITIFISAQSSNNMLVMEIRNPFDPQTSTPKRGTGFGLSSVQRRLYLLYSRNDLLSTQQESTTFITTLRIPQSV